MSGKGSGRRAGANDVAYRENYERTFGEKSPARKAWDSGITRQFTKEEIQAAKCIIAGEPPKQGAQDAEPTE